MTKAIYALLGAFLLACAITSISYANASGVCLGLCVDNHQIPRHQNGHYYVHPAHRHGHVTWDGRAIQRQPMYYREGTVWHQVYWYPTAPKYYVQQPPRGYVLAQPPVYQAPQPVYQAPAYAVATAPAPQPAYRPAPQQTLSPADLAQLNALRLKQAVAIMPPPDGGQVGGMSETRKVGTPPSPNCHVPDGPPKHDATLGGTVQRWKRIC